MAFRIRSAQQGCGQGQVMNMGAQALFPAEQVQGLGQAVTAICSSHVPWCPRGPAGPELWGNIQTGPGVAMGRNSLCLEAPWPGIHPTEHQRQAIAAEAVGAGADQPISHFSPMATDDMLLIHGPQGGNGQAHHGAPHTVSPQQMCPMAVKGLDHAPIDGLQPVPGEGPWAAQAHSDAHNPIRTHGRQIGKIGHHSPPAHGLRRGGGL